MQQLDLLEIEKILFNDLPLPRQNNSGCWGYVDHNDIEVIPFIYKEADHFYDDLAIVRRFNDPKYGFINTEGNVAIPFLFDQAKGFCNGFCSVKIGKKWGAINTYGKLLIKPEYDYIGSFYEEHGQMVAEAIKDGDKGLINYSGKVLIPFL